MAEKPVTISGPVHHWSLDPEGEKAREYLCVTLPFGDARRCIKSEYYNAATGQGEQRGVAPSHVKKLKKAMETGQYTPTPIGVSVPPHMRGRVVRKGGEATLTDLAISDPLRSVDGNHRFEALLTIFDWAERTGDDDTMARVNAQPITVMVYLDGDAQQDFVNLQAGKTVDANHVMSLKVKRGMLPAAQALPAKFAFEAGQILNRQPSSPFATHIRFDSRNNLANLKINSLAGRAAGDLSSSLCGLAKFLPDNTDYSAAPQWMANLVTEVSSLLRHRSPDLMKEGMPLAAPPDMTVGSACLTVGLAVTVAFRLKQAGKRAMEMDDKERLVRAVNQVFDEPANGNLSAPAKRHYMGRFAAEYLADLDGEFHGDVPVELLRATSASAWGAPPLPRVAVPRRRAAAAATEEAAA